MPRVVNKTLLISVHWKQTYFARKLDNEPCAITDERYKHKIEQLERMVCQLTMDNGLLKKALKSSNNHENPNGRFSEIISPLTKMSGGGAR
ncbi:hypothetical protein KKB18_12600 [bacterium]|nr:hypothetical protein [bacterium]